MGYLDTALTKIMNEYDHDRTVARLDREKRVEEVHEKFPEIMEIEKEINRLGVENFGNIIKNPEKSKEINESFEKNLKELNDKKKKILKENNIPLDYNEVRYKCEKCLDTGYEDTKKCSCFIQKLIKIRYKISNMETILKDFEEFSFDFYSDKIDGNGMSERENIQDIYNRAVEFSKSSEGKSMLFYGNCGTGKTFLSSCVAKAMMDKGYSVIYMTASGIVEKYEEYKYGKGDYDRDIIDMFYDTDLLIIDDLGTEAQNAVSMQFIFELINKRILNGKKMIISTNLSVKDIIARYTARIGSRLYENFEILNFRGRDIRIQQLERNVGK